jgi:beta-lactamase superfamily II metal-dependent hydrolase
MTLRFEFLDARHGDCFLVRWAASHVMLIDGGPSNTYEQTLRPYLEALPAGAGGQRVLDVVCLTHVDDDHVAGILRLLTELRRAVGDPAPAPFRIKRFWFNSVEELVETDAPGLFAQVQRLVMAPSADAAAAASINQGRDVRDRAAGLGLAGNPPFDGLLITRRNANVGRLRVTVVAPDEKAVKILAEKWQTAKKRADPSVIAAAYSDGSVPNLSSIVLYIGHEQATALLTGDARGDRILAGLRANGLLTDTPMHVGLLKLPHHGSNNNVERSFFEQIHADHYVISADGLAHHHPNEETLRWLVESRDRYQQFTVHLTNEIPFAIRVLDELRHGREFQIVVREAGQPLVINLERP